MRRMDVRILSPGRNWMDVASRFALGLGGYVSPLPRGSTVSVTTGDPAAACTDAPALVSAGKYHMAFTTPAWYGRLAYDGHDMFDKPLPIRALAVFHHDDRLALAVRKETGLRKLSDIQARRYPLRISMPHPDTRHPTATVITDVFSAAGFGFADIETWGGALLRDRPANLNAARGPLVSRGFDAVFDEALMTRRWKRLTDRYDLTFLEIDDEILRRLEAKGWPRGTIRKGRFRGVTRDVPTVDMTGWMLLCREDMDEELAYHTIAAIDAQAASINAMFRSRYAPMTGPVDLATLAQTPVPLHPGAERYYREHGHIPSRLPTRRSRSTKNRR